MGSDKYKPNDYGLRTINCICRDKGTQELSDKDVVEVAFYNKNIPNVGPWGWADIILNGKIIADCNEQFFKAQFKKV